MKKDIFALLIGAKNRVDVGYLEKYITDSTSNDINLINGLLAKANELRDYRYTKYGSISEADCLGGGDVSEQVKCSLSSIQVKLDKYGFKEDVVFRKDVNANWDKKALLLMNLLEIENFNLCLFIEYLENRKKEVLDNPDKFVTKREYVTMRSSLTENELKCVYNYIKTNTPYFSKEGNVSIRNFIRIFRSYSASHIDKVKVAKRRGAKAYLRALIEELTGDFDSKIINMCFCYEDGSALNISSHDRRQKGVSVQKMLNG